MKNQLTVTVSMPWLPDMSKATYDNLFRTLMKIAKDESRLGCIEAKHLLSGMAGKQPEYSYDAAPFEIDFPAYAVLSEYVPNKELHVSISKTGEHVQIGPKDDPRYYNLIGLDFESGKMVKQTLAHLEAEGAVPEDAVELSGNSMKSKMAGLKGVAAEMTASRQVKAPVLNPGIVAEKEAETDFSFG